MNSLKNNVTYIIRGIINLSLKSFIGRKLPDKVYLTYKYYEKFHRLINWKNPRTFNEKLQWLKIYDRKKIYTTMVDKYAAKKYVADVIGKEYIIPTLGIWEKYEDIDFDKLPNQFVLKCTHDSGGLVIVKDKNTMDRSLIRTKLEQSLKTNYYLEGREWPYKNVPRRIIAEKYMSQSASSGNDSDKADELLDYKFMCFNGKVKCSFVCTERFSKSGLKVTFFDRNWNVMPFERHYPKSSVPISKPKSYEKMISIAEKLSKGIDFLRVDLYEINGHIYFGELTFYPGCGYEEFKPEKADLKLGEWIRLTQKKNKLFIGRR